MNKKKKSKKVQEQHVISSDSEADDDNIIRTIDPLRTPTFNGRHLNSTAASSPAVNSINNDSWFKMIEANYLKPLLIGQERLEKMMKSLHKNQVEIQKALKKKQV
jgi:hypothetical protein